MLGGVRKWYRSRQAARWARANPRPAPGPGPSLPPCWPVYRELRDIMRHGFVANRRDCSNAAGEYARACVGDGLDAQCVMVDLHDELTLHVIVEVRLPDGVFVYVDPTWDRWSTDIGRWGRIIWAYSRRDLWRPHPELAWRGPQRNERART